MDRAEALIHFRKNTLEPLLTQTNQLFEENKLLYIEKFKNEIISSIQKIKQDTKVIHYVHFQLPRISIVEESYEVLVYQYNQYWFLDEEATYERLSLAYLFEPFTALRKTLEEEKKIYIGKINSYDIQQMILEIVEENFMKLSTFIREWLWDLEEEEWIKHCGFAPNYHIRWGMYMEKGEIVFAIDERAKQTEELNEMLKNKPKNLFYSVWKNSQLENTTLEQQELLFISFKQSQLKTLNFNKAIFFRSNFKGASLEECQFEGANLNYSTFEKAILKKCSFKGANLTGVDFRQTEFLDVSFEDANVESAIFTREAVPFLKLSSRQLQNILIEEEGE